MYICQLEMNVVKRYASLMASFLSGDLASAQSLFPVDLTDKVVIKADA